MAPDHPISSEGVTSGYLSGLLAELYPGVRVETVRIVESKTYGQQMVSTAGRVAVEVDFAPGAPPNLPTRFVVKLAHSGLGPIMSALYANEVAFYLRIRPELKIEAPQVYGGAFDGATVRFALLLEDLSVRGVRFPNVTQPITVENVRALLDTLAVLHGHYWESPRFRADLAWVQTHLKGDLAVMMNELSPPFIQRQIDTENFKRELVQRLRTTGPELLAGVQAVQRHQATLPQTLLHGDTHLGNTYMLPDGRAGLLDWQLMVRGYAMHDVSYFITTALSIQDRREHERDLLIYYLDRLRATGIASVPALEDAWLEYRRAPVWGVYIGWLTTPVVNYGWEINVLNHLRLTTAFEDHDTGRLVQELL